MSILTMFKKKVHNKAEENDKTSGEIWKPLKISPKYSVSNFGRVRNNEKNKILKMDCYCGRPKVKIDRKNKLICNLVAETFINNPNEYRGVININGDVNDNRVENLRWCIQTHVHCCNKSSITVNEEEIRKEFLWENVAVVKRLAKKYRINTEQVLKIVNN